MTDIDSTEYSVLLTNAPAQAKFLLNSLEHVAEGIGLYWEPIKTSLLSVTKELKYFEVF